MDPELQKLLDEIRQNSANLEEIRGKLKDQPTKDALLAEAEERITRKITGLFAEKQKLEEESEARKKALEDTLKIVDEMRAAIARNGMGAGDIKTAEQEQRRLMRAYMRSGQNAPAFLAGDEYRSYLEKLPEELRSLTEGTATDGGFLVPPVVDEEIIKNIVNMSPFRSLARVIPITGPEYKTFTRTGRPTASWGGELSDPSDSQSAYGELRIAVHDIISKTPASQNLLMDAVRIEDELRQDAEEEIARTEGLAFISGDGVIQPEGILTNAKKSSGGIPVINGVNAATDVLSSDDFYNLKYGNGASGKGLQTEYRAQAAFLMNSNTLNEVLKLKDGNDNYLWNLAGGLQDGEPAKIAGSGFKVMEDMEDIADGKYPLAFGDWRQTYRIIDRVGTMLQIDPYTRYPLVLFKWLKRVGGKVVKTESARFIKL